MAQKKSRKYKKVGCHTSKTAAQNKAKSMRSQGLTAQARGKCVYSAGKRKAVTIKKTGQRLSGTRRKKRA